MTMDALKEKTAYPCAPSSTEQLDAMLQTILDGGGADLHRFVCMSDFREVSWGTVRHLRIVGDNNARVRSSLNAASISHGFWLNADTSWLLIRLKQQSHEDSISHCGTHLESLWIISAGMSELPGLKNLTQLTSLRLYKCNSLTGLLGVENLKRLTTLDLLRCESLTQLPGLRNLAQLTNLNLSWCRSLTTLNLSGCKSLSKLLGLETLTQLIALNLSGCSSLIALPKLGNLKRLFSLNISRCTALTSLNLAGCTSLSELMGLEHLTQLTTLNLSRCRSLSTLNLSGCRSLSKLLGLEGLTRLTSLNLSGCSSLTHLTELRGLMHLTSLNLAECRSLTTLNLSGCISLTHLTGLESLAQLTTLDLSTCISLSKLPALERLTRLTSLNLSRCESLTELPGLENLTWLTSLNLSGCSSFTQLPAELRYMASLRELDLRYLRLQELPDWLPEIAESFSLGQTEWFERPYETIVYLDGTTVENISDMSIFEQPYEVVAEWFEKRSLGQTHPLNEIKVVFLGDGESGKSHTIARLMNDGGEPDFAVFDGQSTPGIVIRNKEYDLGDRTIQVHYWDFGGQEIMHSMHRIFLTGRTMYVILLNARDDTQSDRAKYWLHNVKSFAPDAPVLLVLNKIDQNENASVDEVDLRNRYQMLTQVVRLSALNFSREEFNRAFTNVLLEEIRKTGYLDAQWPISWTKVKEKLEQMPTHYIMGDAYEDICQECKVDRNQKDLLHWFNDLGVSFCCCDEKDYKLKDYVILRPDWITNALYILLFNPLESARNGRVPHKTIFDILRNAHKKPGLRCTLPTARYTNNDIQYVLGVMRKFNLSLADGEDHEFIPMLCQRNSTVDIRYHQQDADTLEFNMEFDYLPSNLLHRLMVERHHELDMEKVWRTGARFHVPDLGWSAVVVIDDRTLRFFIRHTDPMHRPNTYLSMLKTNVDRIVEKMNLKPPVCQLTYKLDNGRDSFHYEMLKGMRKLHQTHVYSMAWQRMIPIADILNQSAPDGLDEEMKLLDGIMRACRSIQDELVYRLIKNENSAGYVNGAGMEDLRNRRIRDDLSKMNFTVSDQSQRGSSGSGKSIGELDMLVLDEYGDPWTIIEALRVSDEKKETWNAHLDKLLNKYNSRGLPRLYLLTYVDAEPTAFAEIWTSYQEHIKKRKALPYTYSEGSFADLNDARSPRYIKAAKCQYTCGGDPINVYHIFVRIPTQNG